MSQSSKAAKPESFEKNIERLDSIVRRLEDADLPLEKALQIYEEGMKISEVCQKQLQEAEGRIQVLMKRAGGKIVAEPLNQKRTKRSRFEHFHYGSAIFG